MNNMVFDSPLVKSKISYDRYVSLLYTLLNEPIESLTLNLKKRTGLNFIQYLSYIPIICKSKNKTIKIFADDKTLYLMQKRICSLPSGDFKSKDIFSCLLQNTKLIHTKEEVLEWVEALAEEAPVSMDDRLTDIFTTYIGEIFNNSLEHSGASYILGSRYSKRTEKIYTFSIYDTGKGIPENVRNFLKKNMSDSKAIEWALESGHTTVVKKDIPRGAGFNLLHSFAENNNGEIRILSGKVLYIYGPKIGKKYYILKEKIVGTLFEMDIVFDPNHRYVLK